MSFPRGIFADDRNQGIVERHCFDYSVSTEPAEEPVTLAEAKAFARIDVSDDDDLVSALIKAARVAVEQETGRKLITQTIDATLNAVPYMNELRLSWRPIQSVVKAEAINEDGTTDGWTVADDLLVDGTNARVGIKSTAPAITSDRSFNAFLIQYEAGYGDASDVPEWAKTAIKQLVSHWYEHREASQEETVKNVPYAIQLILDEHKVAGL